MNAPIEMHLQTSQATRKYTRARPLLGTLVEISTTSSSESEALAAIAKSFAAVETVHGLMSYHETNSDVSRINREAYAREIEVHEHTWRVMRAARLMSEISHGAFDITVANQLVRFGFLPAQEYQPVKTAYGNWRDISLTAPNRVRLLGNVQIDLSGIAKGYAVDLAIQALKEVGMQAGCINAGGDMRVFGAESHGIQVRNPAMHTQTIPLLHLADGAAATTAGYYSDHIYEGRKVLPIIQPQSGIVCSSGRSVTIIAKDCMTADALTKVVYANPRGALAVLNAYKARAMIVEHEATSNACHIYDSKLITE